MSDPYYMGTLDEIVERDGQSSVLSKIDLAKGYYQVPVAAGSKEKTAFISPYGKYEFSRMPFGLKKCPCRFQRMMDGVLNEVHDCAAPYIDDIVMFSEIWDSHLRDLRSVLGVLGKHGLTAKPAKCAWGRSYIKYLGNTIGGGKRVKPSMRRRRWLNMFNQSPRSTCSRFWGARTIIDVSLRTTVNTLLHCMLPLSC